MLDHLLLFVGADTRRLAALDRVVGCGKCSWCELNAEVWTDLVLAFEVFEIEVARTCEDRDYD